MTNKELVDKLYDIVNNYKTVYMWGVFGSPVTEKIISEKSAQYPSWYTSARLTNLRSLIGKGYFAFDCVNTIKGLLWGWNGDASKHYGGAKYNPAQDVSADGMISICKEVSTDFSVIDIGEAVWLSGHIGVYVGDGLVIECTPSWKNGVQITELSARKWLKHGKIPYIEYVATDTIVDTKEHWGKKYRDYLLTIGYDIQEERYDEPVTRAELFAFTAKKEGFKE